MYVYNIYIYNYVHIHARVISLFYVVCCLVLSTGFHFAQTGRGRKGQQGGGKEEVRKVESLQNHVGENTSALSCTFLRKFVPKVVVPIFKKFLRQKKSWPYLRHLTFGEDITLTPFDSYELYANWSTDNQLINILFDIHDIRRYWSSWFNWCCRDLSWSVMMSSMPLLLQLSSVHNREPSESHGRDLRDRRIGLRQGNVQMRARKALAICSCMYLPCVFQVNPFQNTMRCHTPVNLCLLILLSVAMVWILHFWDVWRCMKHCWDPGDSIGNIGCRWTWSMLSS